MILSIRRVLLLFVLSVLLSTVPFGAEAQSPGSILFCGAATETQCYFKPGEESKVKLASSFSASTPNIYFRAYFSEPMGVEKLTLSLYKDGSFFKGIADKEGYTPANKTAFTDLTNAVWWNDKPFPPGSYKLEVSKRVNANQKAVIATGHFTIR